MILSPCQGPIPFDQIASARIAYTSNGDRRPGRVFHMYAYIISLMRTVVEYGILYVPYFTWRCTRMNSPRHGSAIIMLILGVLVIAIGSLMATRSLVPTGGQEGPTPVQRSWDAVCATNKALITQQLQLYSMTNPPMKELDLKRLFSGSFNLPAGCPCSYSIDPAGNVVCATHH